MTSAGLLEKKISSSRIDLEVGGFVPFSTTDYPGKMAAVVFCHGCPWRCAYCHNAHLRSGSHVGKVSWCEIRDFLRRRAGLLEGVVFSGGEPTCQSWLGEAVREVKGMGYSVGLHTAGVFPGRLRELLPQLDWVGLDIKALFEKYGVVTGCEGSGESALESAKLVLQSGIDYEFRTTVHSSWISESELFSLAKILSRMNVKRYVLQEFRKQGCDRLDVIHEESLSDEIIRRVSSLFASFEVRKR